MHHLSRQNATSITFVPSLNCVYLNNPKAGCSTVRRSLWQAHDQRAGVSTYQGTPHRKQGSPFISDPAGLANAADRIRDARWFSVVRNPYSRALSAYLDKFRKNGDPNVIRPFRRRYAWTKAQLPTFVEFLRIISADSPEALDHHFRPQTHMLLVPYTPLEFVGYVEHMDDAEAWMHQMSHEISISDHRPHATGASGKVLERYDDESIDLVQQVYRDDFSTFGYSLDINDPLPDRSVGVPTSSIALDYLGSMIGPRDDRAAAFARIAERLPQPRPPWHAQHGISTGLASDVRAAVAEVSASSHTSWRTAKTLATALAGVNEFTLAEEMLQDAQRRFLPAVTVAKQILGEPVDANSPQTPGATRPTWFYEANFGDEAVEAGEHRIATGGRWDELGDLQFNYLVGAGLQPHHRLLDLGCGPLRGGVRFAAFLEPGNYYGLDVNRDLLHAGRWELESLGLSARVPEVNLFATSTFDAGHFGVDFNFILAQSLFTHLSLSQVRLALTQSSKVLAPGGAIYATFFERPAEEPVDRPVTHSSGVVTFSDHEPYDHTLADLVWAADAAGMTIESLGDWEHPDGQFMARITGRD